MARQMRIARRLFTVFSALSFIVFAVLAVFWLRAYLQGNDRTTGHDVLAFCTGAGGRYYVVGANAKEIGVDWIITSKEHEVTRGMWFAAHHPRVSTLENRLFLWKEPQDFFAEHFFGVRWTFLLIATAILPSAWIAAAVLRFIQRRRRGFPVAVHVQTQ